MACFAATLLIILYGFISLSAANKDACELNAAVGQSLTLPFDYYRLSNSHVLRWTHNENIIFYRERGRVSFGKKEDISATGSLLLKNVQLSNAGTYQVNVLHPNNTLAKTWSGRLCVMDKVSKPQLTYSCDLKSDAVILNCHVADPKGLVFSWTLDENTLTSETKQKLSITLTKLKGESNFTCSVENKISKEKSDTVRPNCKSLSPPPPTLLCFTSKTVVATLVGEAALTLLLLTIIFVLCCCHRQNKSKMTFSNTGQLGMIYRSKRETVSISPDYETMQPTEVSACRSSQSSAEACYESVSPPGAPTENLPPQLATVNEGQQPSPVPKPRTKSPKTQNIWI